MSKDVFKSVLGYLSAMAQAKCLLRQGIITQNEYMQIEKMFCRKYRLSKHSIFREKG